MKISAAIKVRCCILAVLFLTGILGDFNVQKNLSPVPQRGMQTEAFQGTMQKDTATSASLSAVQLQGKMDDFHTGVSVWRTAEGSAEAAEAAVVALVFILLFFGLLTAEHVWQIAADGGSSVYRLILYIHRTDGKKRLLFWMKSMLSKQEDMVWKSEQNIKFYLLMRRKKFSII